MHEVDGKLRSLVAEQTRSLCGKVVSETQTDPKTLPCDVPDRKAVDARMNHSDDEPVRARRNDIATCTHKYKTGSMREHAAGIARQ